MTTSICNAQGLIDGHTWSTKMTENEKVIYVVAYIDGVTAGVSQGVRFAMDTRLPDQKMFKKAFSIWTNIIHFGTLIKQIDNYYIETSKRDVAVMHAIMSILVEQELKKLKLEFLHAATRAAHSGFDIIEFSTYLDSQEKPDLFTQFFSPRYNTRTDEYGGSIENRIRFIHGVVSEIRKSLPPNIMLAYSLTLPPYDLTDEILDFIDTLKKIGIEMLNIDFSGAVESSQIQFLRSKFPGFPLVLSG